MPAYLMLAGQPALSEFRLGRLLEQLRRIDVRAVGLDARFVYAVWSDQPLTVDGQARLAALLEVAVDAATPAGQPIWVVPRLGTVSPWASKATDIAHNCGMTGVRRIERGIEFRVEARSGLLAGLVGPPAGADRADRAVLQAHRHASGRDRFRGAGLLRHRRHK